MKNDNFKHNALKILKLLNENREKVGELLELIDEGMPNVETKTLGGKVFWKKIVDHAGWRLQKNKLMGNCRILNPEGIRVAWGGESSMRRAFNKMIDQA
ncbi:MAG: hypothetical protein P8P49_13440 [Opitutales bacterium]|nr:hypothetical protein [Opitutales bacterium]